MYACLLACIYSIIITYIPCYVMCDGCLDDVDVGCGLAARHPHEVYGFICGGSGESQMGGGNVRSSRDITCP